RRLRGRHPQRLGHTLPQHRAAGAGKRHVRAAVRALPRRAVPAPQPARHPARPHDHRRHRRARPLPEAQLRPRQGPLSRGLDAVHGRGDRLRQEGAHPRQDRPGHVRPADGPRDRPDRRQGPRPARRRRHHAPAPLRHRPRPVRLRRARDPPAPRLVTMRAAAAFSTLALAAALVGCPARRGGQKAPATGAPGAEPAPALTEEVLDDLTMFATGRRLPADERRAHLARLASGETTLEQYARSLVEAPEFARVVAPRVLLGYLATAPFSFEVMPLQSREIDGVRVHYRKEPCKPSEAEPVSPWWDMASTIQVCRDDHRPTIIRDSEGHYCHGGTGGFVGKECGCGPNLIFCSASAEHTDQIVWSLLQESLQTISYIVSHDMPLREVFTTRYSFRDRNAAWTYLRDEIVNGKRDRMPDLASWPEQGAWAP